MKWTFPHRLLAQLVYSKFPSMDVIRNIISDAQNTATNEGK
jgi:hypothetical protein